jgi:two-component system chemotaxis response regulator CheB
MSSPCRILIVDDSIVMRSQIRAAIGEQSGMEVVGTASNGKIACQMLTQKQVDIVTLDLEMPIMNGLETLAEIKRLGLKPQVIVFSSLSVAGAEATLKALAAGASDFIAKPDLTRSDDVSPALAIRKDLLPRLEQLMQRHREEPVSKTTPPATAIRLPKTNFLSLFPKIVVIASSTGGPRALEEFIMSLKPPIQVPILITQHMPPLFTASLASRLQKLSGIPTAEVKDGETLLPGHIYIAPGDYHFSVNGTADAPRAKLDQGPQRNSVRPCADFLFESASALFKERCLGIVLTGMGADGLDGAIAIKKNRGGIIIQTKESCVVFGMPGAVFEADAYDRMGTPQEIAGMLSDLRVTACIEKAV